MTSTTFDLSQLLLHCAHASNATSHNLRLVQTNSLTNHHLADAQLSIINYIHNQFPQLTIHSHQYNTSPETDRPICMHVPVLPHQSHQFQIPFQIPHHLQHLLCIHTAIHLQIFHHPSPLPATHESNIDIIIALIFMQRSIAAVLSPTQSCSPPIIALVDAGVHNLTESQQITSCHQQSDHVYSSNPNPYDVAKRQKYVANHKLSASSNIVDQALSIASGDLHLCISNNSSPVLNIAALEAIITASGGIVTDVFGKTFRYGTPSQSPINYGFVASSKLFNNAPPKNNHARLCHSWRNDMIFDNLLQHTGMSSIACPQATDVALDINGNPLTSSVLSKILKTKVSGFAAPNASAVRYLMSTSCRLSLQYHNLPQGPKSIFMKRIAMDELEHVKYKMKTAPHKLLRDISSYKVESEFLITPECRAFETSRTRIVKAYHIDSHPASPDVPAMYSRFIFFLEDFAPEDGWFQCGMLNFSQTASALDSLASFHAYFSNPTAMEGYSRIDKCVWDQGTYWLPSRQAPDCIEKVPSCWEKHVDNFGDAFDDIKFEEPNVLNLRNFGQVLAKYARQCADSVHSYGKNTHHPERTLIHGDAKAANLLFRKPKVSVDDNKDLEDLEVRLIDFQWCGWGHPVVDVAYLIVSSVHPSVLEHSGRIEWFLRYYYQRLVEHINIFKGKEGLASDTWKYSSMKEVFADAVLDLARTVVSYHWVRIGASPLVLESRAEMRGSNAYNKNLESAKWLIRTSADLLLHKIKRTETHDTN